MGSGVVDTSIAAAIPCPHCQGANHTYELSVFLLEVTQPIGDLDDLIYTPAQASPTEIRYFVCPVTTKSFSAEVPLRYKCHHGNDADPKDIDAYLKDDRDVEAAAETSSEEL